MGMEGVGTDVRMRRRRHRHWGGVREAVLAGDSVVAGRGKRVYDV